MTKLLRAGRLEARLEAPDVADLRVGGVELLRRVGVRVREVDWGTVAPAIEDERIRSDGSRFELGFAARHRGGAIDFAWHCSVAGSPTDVTYEMDGIAEAEFDFARIGIVLLHPPELTAGRPFRARGPEGRIDGTLPRRIGPQLVTDGEVRPLFPGFEELEIDVTPALTLVFELEGDVFEMEDQRNWTDASFKTYSTPVGLPLPHHARAAERFRQRVHVHLRGDAPVRRSARSRPALTLGEPAGGAFPAVGTMLAVPPSAAERRLLDALAPCHLRVELDTDDDAAARLARADEAAPDTPLEVAVWLSGDPRAARERLTEVTELVALRAPRISRLIVHSAGRPVTSAEDIALARELVPLAASVPLVGGSAANFAELNRERELAAAAVDGLVFALNPQVHDSDDRSVLQTVTVQGDTVATAEGFARGLPVHVSPATLLPRGTTRADARQSSLLAAAWTAGSAAALAAAGAASATYFEVSGDAGTMRDGIAFPVYHVLRELCAWRAAPLVPVHASERLRATGVAVKWAAGVALLVANLTDERVEVELDGLPAEDVGVAVLDADAAPGFQPCELGGRAGATRVVTLGPYAVARLMSAAATDQR